MSSDRLSSLSSDDLSSQEIPQGEAIQLVKVLVKGRSSESDKSSTTLSLTGDSSSTLSDDDQELDSLPSSDLQEDNEGSPNIIVDQTAL